MSSSMHICVTIFRTDCKFQPVSKFTELHAVILAAHSYALLVEVRKVGHTVVITLFSPLCRLHKEARSRSLQSGEGDGEQAVCSRVLHGHQTFGVRRTTHCWDPRLVTHPSDSRNWLESLTFEAFLFCEFTAACSNCVILGQIYHEWLSHIALSILAYMSMYHCGRHISINAKTWHH